MNRKPFAVAIACLLLTAGTGCTVTLDKDTQQIFDGAENETIEDEEFKLPN